MGDWQAHCRGGAGWRGAGGIRGQVIAAALGRFDEALRLRGIACPELGTVQGEAAKRYVQGQVQRATAVTITTTKPDKWDRYLSDVYLTTAEAAEDMFLNNRLLELGFARRYDEVALEDWETA